jgi:hypothetical protein
VKERGREREILRIIRWIAMLTVIQITPDYFDKDRGQAERPLHRPEASGEATQARPAVPAATVHHRTGGEANAHRAV